MADEHDIPTQARDGSRRWSTIAWLLSSAVLVAFVVGVWLRVDDDRAGARLGSAILAGDRPVAPALPDVPLRDSGAAGLPDWYRASEGRQVDADHAEVLVVNWWASWCGPCEDEAPALQEIADEYDGRVTVVGLDAGSQDLERDARAFVRRHELDFTILRGARADEDAWGVAGFPETFVVGTDGRISSHVNGPIDEQTLRALLDDELEQDRA